MTTAVKLIKYDAACRAIAAAKSVDEVKRIRDVSIAMRAYARQAENHDMEADAIEICMRATAAWIRCGRSRERRLGWRREVVTSDPITGVSETPVIQQRSVKPAVPRARRIPPTRLAAALAADRKSLARSDKSERRLQTTYRCGQSQIEAPQSGGIAASAH